MNSDILVFQAKAFYNAFIVLERQNLMMDIPRYTAPVLVNGAFSIELSLKAILAKNGVDYEKEHNLLILFQMLPQKFRDEILGFLIEKAPEYSDPDIFFDEFLLSSNAFVDWRYCFEKQPPAIDRRFISALANASIRGMFTHYNVDLVERPSSGEISAEIEEKFENNRVQYIERNSAYIHKRHKENHS